MRFLVVHNSHLRLQAAEVSRKIRGDKQGTNSLHVTHGGRLLAGSTTIRLINIASGKRTMTYVGHSTTVSVLASAPDDRFFVSGSPGDRLLAVWDLLEPEADETGKAQAVQTLVLPSDPASCVVTRLAGEDEYRIVCVHTDGTASVFDLDWASVNARRPITAWCSIRVRKGEARGQILGATFAVEPVLEAKRTKGAAEAEGGGDTDAGVELIVSTGTASQPIFHRVQLEPTGKPSLVVLEEPEQGLLEVRETGQDSVPDGVVGSEHVVGAAQEKTIRYVSS